MVQTVKNFITLNQISGNAENKYFTYVIEDRKESREMHSHDFFQVLFVEQGHIGHLHENTEVQLTTGDVFIVPPGFMHQVLFKDPASKVFALYFRTELYFPEATMHSAAQQTNTSIKKFLSSIQFNFNNKYNIENSLKVRLNQSQQLTYRALMECLLSQDASSIDADFSPNGSIIDAMLLLVAQGYASQAFGKQQINKINASEEILKECLAYIDQNYTQDISVAKITNEFAISRTTFNQLFPMVAGTTFKQYLTTLRIEQAKRLTAVPSLSFAEIAQMVGYNDFSTFYRNFRKVTGLSPAQYRDNNV